MEVSTGAPYLFRKSGKKKHDLRYPMHIMDIESNNKHVNVSPDMSVETSTANALTSLISLGCRSSRESFARKLQFKLQNLGNSDKSSSIDHMSNSSYSSWHPGFSNPYNNGSTLGENPKEDPTSATSHLHFHQNGHSNNNNNNNVRRTDVISSKKEKSDRFQPLNAASSGVEVLADSDFVFDFDVGSPSSPPAEAADSSPHLINECDNLESCAHFSPTSTGISDIGNESRVQDSQENKHDKESGCVFSSPASSLSPDGSSYRPDSIPWLQPCEYQDNNCSQGTLARVESTVSDNGDAGSETSDSVYYDVESSFSSTSSSRSESKDSLNGEIVGDGEDLKDTGSDETATDVVDASSKSAPNETDKVIHKIKKNSLVLNKGKPPETLTFDLETIKKELKEASKQKLLSPSNCGNAEDVGEEEEEKIPRVQRSSSLKTGKTPPSTPGGKKIVRFADVMGLDLADVRTFLDEIPKVPKSAYSDLNLALDSLSSSPAFSSPKWFQRRPSSTVGNSSTQKTLFPTFSQPSSMPDFFDRIRDQKVLLENAFIGDNHTIKGTVRVMNMDFHKSVYIRYTTNDWKTFAEQQASYVTGSCDGFSDRFEFCLPVNINNLEVGTNFTFACRFHCQGQQWWDNNLGRNYIFQCVPTVCQRVPSSFEFSVYGSSPDDPWVHHMWM